MTRRLVRAALVAIATLLALALVLTGLDALWPAPAALALTSRPAPGRSPVPAELPGTWTVASGTAGYRAWERHVITPHLAVARTGDVEGSLTLAHDPGGLAVTAATVSVRLAGLRSVDSNATNLFASRDPYVADHLDVRRYPFATFTIDRPLILRSPSSTAGLAVPGNLTIHGTTRTVRAILQAEQRDGDLVVAGAIQTRMTDFDVSPPYFPPSVTVDPALTLEFELRYTRER